MDSDSDSSGNRNSFERLVLVAEDRRRDRVPRTRRMQEKEQQHKRLAPKNFGPGKCWKCAEQFLGFRRADELTLDEAVEVDSWDEEARAKFEEERSKSSIGLNSQWVVNDAVRDGLCAKHCSHWGRAPKPAPPKRAPPEGPPPELRWIVSEIGTWEKQKQSDFLEVFQSQPAHIQPQCSGKWTPHTSAGECQECSKQVSTKEDGCRCSNGGHWMCWNPCFFKQMDWENLAPSAVEELLRAANA